ncbi:hypothetical protein G7054_g13687 [Neopestalotiopsis clavispora]|nr:hypothetical protein G7054_g13687 [Neopestalotiopsis clavispora]
MFQKNGHSADSNEMFQENAFGVVEERGVLATTCLSEGTNCRVRHQVSIEKYSVRMRENELAAAWRIKAVDRQGSIIASIFIDLLAKLMLELYTSGAAKGEKVT